MNQQPPPITLNEVLEQMESGNPFNIIFRKADKKRNTGGQKKELKKVVLHGTDWNNSIRRLRKPNSDEITDVHIRLILYFNSRRVFY